MVGLVLTMAVVAVPARSMRWNAPITSSGFVDWSSSQVIMSAYVATSWVNPLGIKRGKGVIVQDALLRAMKAFAGFLGVVYLNNTPWDHGID